MRKRLKTHDMLRQWDVGDATNLNLFLCPFCKMVPDSHNHLFFECSFPSQVWSLVRSRAGMDGIGPIWDDIVDWIKPLSTKRSIVSVVARLVLAATTYFIWQERNFRLFQNQSRKVAQVRDIIVHNVRLKLLTFRFKKMNSVVLLLDTWNVSDVFAEGLNTTT